MTICNAISRKAGLLAAFAGLAMCAFGLPARATVVRIHFSGTLAPLGPGTSTPFSGYADLTLGTDPLAKSTFPAPTRQPIPGGPDTPPPAGTGPSGTNRVDPPGALAITGATGMFNGVTIDGYLPISSPQTVPSAGEYIPGSVSRITTGNFGGLTYDDLFYPGGVPITCLWYFTDDGTTAAKYPFTGGFLDVYGVVFKLSDNTYLELWGNGNGIPGVGPGPLNYGAIRFAPDGNGGFNVLDLQFSGVRAYVPEPVFLWAFGTALLGLFGLLRWRETRKARPTD